MMLAYGLVRLIETHSETLANSLLQRVQHSVRTAAYRNVPPEELKQRVYEVYLHLGEWLLDTSEAEIERRYSEIGSRRAQQGVPVSQVIWAIVLTKDTLWEYIIDESFSDRPVQAYGKQELLQLLDQFFDRAIHAAAVGYETAGRVKVERQLAKVA